MKAPVHQIFRYRPTHSSPQWCDLIPLLPQSWWARSSLQRNYLVVLFSLFWLLRSFLQNRSLATFLFRPLRPCLSLQRLVLATLFSWSCSSLQMLFWVSRFCSSFLLFVWVSVSFYVPRSCSSLQYLVWVSHSYSSFQLVVWVSFWVTFSSFSFQFLVWVSQTYSSIKLLVWVTLSFRPRLSLQTLARIILFFRPWQPISYFLFFALIALFQLLDLDLNFFQLELLLDFDLNFFRLEFLLDFELNFFRLEPFLEFELNFFQLELLTTV